MPKEFKAGCERPKADNPSPEPTDDAQANPATNEEVQPMIQVGKPAPNFSAPAFYQGKFAEVELKEYLGKWVLLCFYPGDFTFV